MVAQNKHKLTINRVESLIKKAFEGKTLKFRFTVQMGVSGMKMHLIFENEYNINSDLRYVEEDNSVMFYFKMPEEWSMGEIKATDARNNGKSESELIKISFLDGMEKLKRSRSSKYKWVNDVLKQDGRPLEETDWYKETVLGIIESLKNVRMNYRCKRVLKGAFTNKSDEYPVLQVNFNTGKIYIIDRDKNTFRSFCSIDKLNLQLLKSESTIRTNSFAGSFVEGTFDSRIDKLSFRVL